jgi:hypothetical protein
MLVHRRGTRRPLWAAFALSLAGALVGLLLGAPQAHAAGADIGHRDFSFAGAGDEPTADKPQSKLWFNDGLWWADMFDSASNTWHIFRLNRATQTWVNTGTRIDDRPSSRGDALWDGTHLYVATNVVAVSSAGNIAGEPSRLYRFSYRSATHSYTLDAGFPATINDSSSESLALDKDSKGILWATWTQDQNVYVNSTNGTDTAWGKPFVLGVTGSSGLSADDISSIASYGGSKVGLLWSNQATSTLYYALHRDTDPRATWSGHGVLSAPNIADDHLSLKQLQGDSTGHLYAAVKTSLDLTGSQTASQMLLLSLDVNTGSWQSTEFGTVADCHTRPQIFIDSTHQVLHMFASAPSSGPCLGSGTLGSIYEKTTPLSKLSFPPGRGTPVISDGASPEMDDITGTKQNITASTGLIVMASNSATQQYWHADVPLSGADAPLIASGATAGVKAPATLGISFKAAPIGVRSPLGIRFAGASTARVTRWSWTFGDRRASTGQNPTHTYARPGTYTVTVTGTAATGKRASSSRKIKVIRAARAAR